MDILLGKRHSQYMHLHQLHKYHQVICSQLDKHQHMMRHKYKRQ